MALCFEKSLCTTVAILGVLRAGGAFLLLDPYHPVSRLETIIQDAGVKILLTSKLQSTLHLSGVEQITVDESGIVELSAATQFNTDELDPSNALYLIFTSGTTGKPKGIIVENAAYCSGAMEHSKAYGLDSNSRVLQFASYSFDASIQDTLTTLLVGGCICDPSEYDRNNNIVEVINQMLINWADITPSFAALISP